MILNKLKFSKNKTWTDSDIDDWVGKYIVDGLFGSVGIKSKLGVGERAYLLHPYPNIYNKLVYIAEQLYETN